MAEIQKNAPSSQDLKEKFFQGMSYAAATVNVITSDGPSGKVGLTVSAMSSVSADTPRPTLLVCINENSASAAPILDNGVFCVNILHDHQSFISDVFAGRYKDEIEDKFKSTEWVTGKTGSPRVADVLVGFDCEIVSTKKIGTHYVVFGEVVDISIAQKGSALIYANRSYGASQPFTVEKFTNFDAADAPRSLSLGCFHTFGPYFVPGMIKGLTQSGTVTSVNLVEGDNRRLKEAVLAGEVELALMYDFDLCPDIETTTVTEFTPYILLAQNHPLAKKDTIRPKDLKNQPMISIAEAASRDHLEGILRKSGIEPNVVFRSTSFEMMRGMVGHGLGFALALTKPATSESYDGKTIVVRKLDAEFMPSKVVLTKRKGGKLSDAAGQLWDETQQNHHSKVSLKTLSYLGG